MARVTVPSSMRTSLIRRHLAPSGSPIDPFYSLPRKGSSGRSTFSHSNHDRIPILAFPLRSSRLKPPIRPSPRSAIAQFPTTSARFRHSWNTATSATDLDHAISPLQTRTEIKIIDYSTTRIEIKDVENTALDSFLQQQPKPAWAACRWIYVNGYNPAVVKTLGKHKSLHHLTIEDVLDPETPPKVDWYNSYCYLVLSLHKLVHLQHHHHSAATESEISEALHGPAKQRIRWRTLSHNNFGISVEEVSAFLTPDNTIITIFEKSGQDVLTPILERLNSPQTIIRTSNDPSMLLQAVIDTIVDLAGPIEKTVANAFVELEQSVLLNPSIGQSKELYVLRSGLAHLMENMMAIGSVVKVLSEHRALPAQSPASPVSQSASQAKHPEINISPLAQVYFKDVQDHLNTLLSSTRMAIRSAENLTSLIFNTIAASQNESVRQLTLISSFFLPLTFLTGYFGMNFDPMPIVNDNSDAVFWLLATPVMLTTALLLGIRSGAFRRSWHRGRGKAGRALSRNRESERP